MSIFSDMLALGNGDIPFDKAQQHSTVALRLMKNRWILANDPADSVVSLVGITRSSDINPIPFIDNAEYTFGVSVKKGKAGQVVVEYNDRARARQAAYIKRIAESGLVKDDPFVKKFIDFISNDPYAQLIDGKSEDQVNEINALLELGNGSIRVCNGENVLAELYADRFAAKITGEVRCSISGQVEPVLDCKPETLKKLAGAIPVVTLSCNTDKFPVLKNYNFDNMDGSPVSAKSYSTITRNLQKLISSKRTCIKIKNSNGILYLLNYDAATDDTKGLVSSILNTPYDVDGLLELGYNDEDIGSDCNAASVATAKEERCEDIVYRKYMSVYKGYINKAKQQGTVKVYRIHAAQGRWSCTDTFQVDLGTMFDNIDRWYTNTVTSGTAHSIHNLLQATVPENGKYQSRDAEDIMQSIMLGKEISFSLLKRVLNRAAITQRSTAYDYRTKQRQYSLIRACYNSIARNHNKKEFTDMLERNNTSYAYNLGRLLALAEYVQKKVHDTAPASTIANRLDKRAVMRPTECIAELLDRIRIYQGQMSGSPDKAWVVTMSNKLQAEITSNLSSTHSGSLTWEEQVAMRIAFVQQNNDFYTKNTTTKKD